jgi:tetratricopeptide (TPR) repeat protein
MRITWIRTIVFLSVTLCAVVLPTRDAAATVAEAREKFAQFKQELNATMAAQQSGDDAGMAKHQEAAKAALDAARKLYDAAKKSLRNDKPALLEYADVMRYAGDYDLAAEALKRVTQLEPENGEAWMHVGDALSHCGPSRAKEAEAAARKAVALMKSPGDSAKAYAALGGLYWREGLYDLSRENYDAAARADAANVPARIGLAALNVREGRPHEAEEALGALGQAPPEALQQLDSLLKEALDGFQQSRRFIPDTAADHLSYAKLLVRAGRPKESIGALERSVKLDPKNPVAWNLLGSISRYLNDTTRAREAFTQSLALKPDDTRTQQALKELDSAPAPQAPGPLAPAPQTPGPVAPNAGQ